LNQLINVLIAAVIAVIVFVVLQALVTFHHSHLIWGLVAVALFLVLAFGGGKAGYVGAYRGRTRV
jgi:hypothetical protein